MTDSFPTQSSVYWFDPDPTSGSELKKIRPCIVVSPNEMNQRLKTVIVVPLTTSIQPWPFRMNTTILGRKTSAACDQLRVVDKSRLKGEIGSLKSTDSSSLLKLLQTIFSG